MNNELTLLQNELTISQLKAELAESKLELQKIQAQKASRLDDSLFSKDLYEHYQKVALTLSKSGIIPLSYKNKPEDIFVAMAMGYQLGFPIEQSLQDVAVINGRPCLWGDGLLSLALNHQECDAINEEPIYNSSGEIIGYCCEVIRKGHKPHYKEFTIQDAQRAGLLKKGGVWTSYPSRMLQMRARSLAIRDKFADALRGLRIAEIEEEDTRIIEAQPVKIEMDTNYKTQADRINSILDYKKEGVIKISNNEEDDKINEKQQENASFKIDYENESITEEQLNEITYLMKEKEFNAERKSKILDYYKVNELESLTAAKARLLILQLGKV